MENRENEIYSHDTLDFVTVCTEYCKYLEQCGGTSREAFVNVMCSLLPMIYLKATLIKELPEEEGYNEPTVTEEAYNYIRQQVHSIMKEHDDYLDVFVEDFKYSESPILCTVSENLADIYQALRNMVEAFRTGYEEAMSVAINDAIEEFRLSWGQALLNALRALHDLRYHDSTIQEA